MRVRKILLSFTVIFAVAGLVACSAPDKDVAATKKETKHETDSAQVKTALEKLEKKYGATLGIYGMDGTGKQIIGFNEQERFAYTSTFKAIAGGILLKNLTDEQLNKRITFSKEDLVDYSPITEKHVASGMTMKEIINAAMDYSDNTAGNLMLHQLGGPTGFEKELVKIGDKTMKPVRYETELNTAVPGDIRDTTTPEAMAKSLAYLVTEGNLPADRLAYFKQTLINNTTGGKLIRAGVPDGYVVGDKTGAGSYGTRNDIAVIYPKDKDDKPLVWVIYSKKTGKDDEYNDQLIADAAKVLSDYYAL
ncbi:beta-lactamase 1 [Listeria weihenstephanensis FSL R9-0317]|uniref:Beta-lactamase n=1 Tax=Listeria weihenstephanensis TaxID=1006155 RepID=A0A1S7FXE4_9LIST|nr:class A beta-lactamase [Listeria weihenstephanensis]AQY52070.1 beta-lactamase [Listeria weihenstephanensis]EUJ37244.1 beta-lactamase 1 [Listeria weihenstephanensis FSL R9-0317]